MFSWLSCKKYIETAEKELDPSEMSMYIRARSKFHHIICLSCRRFLRQIKFLDRACNDSSLLEQLDDVRLSERKKKEIEEQIAD